MVQTSLAERLRILRAREGLTLQEAAERLGINRNTLGALEQGHRSPYLPTLSKLAEGYGVPVESLIAEEEAGDFLGEVAETRQHRLDVEILNSTAELAGGLASRGMEDLARLERDGEMVTLQALAFMYTLKEDEEKIRRNPELSTPERRAARRRAEAAVAQLNDVLNELEAPRSGAVSNLDERRRRLAG